MQRGGVTGLSVALTTPGVRAATVAAAGIAGLPLRVFLPGLFIGNTVFFLLHIVIGYAGGQGVAGLPAATGLPAGPALVGLLLVLAVIGFAGWIIIRRRARRAGAPPPSLGEVAGAWEEACCPACLALGALGEARSQAAFAH